ncbi:hypothetical protein X896_5417 [Burkholderia pseudomallei ABCPW 1]|nr:hypothetical protein X896_5417 [Burkholderia pseudomallei ABCPW 1]
MQPAPAMTASCVHVDGTTSATPVAAVMIVTRRASGHRLRAMPQTACATTAADTIFSPCSAPGASARPAAPATPYANAIIAIADGSVKPAHAASAPA